MMFTLVLAACSVQVCSAARLTADGSQTADAEATAHTNVSVDVLRQHIAVLGHTAFAPSRAYALQADKDGRCNNVLGKVKELINASIMQEEKAVGEVPGMDGERKAVADIERGLVGNDSLRNIEDSLGHMDLNRALKAGNVITMNEMNDIVECESGVESHLDENNQTNGGQSLVEGDMLQPDDKLEASSFLEWIWSGRKWAGTLWPTDTDIRYCFRPGTDNTARNIFESAKKHIQQRTCLRFKEISPRDEHSCAESPAILVQSHEARKCWAHVGMIRWNKINVGEGCWTMAIVVHEIGHAIGMAHEQSRPDRDHFIAIHWENIPREKRHNFQKDAYAYDQDSYDFLSLMHYNAFAFATNRNRHTISALKPENTEIMGQRNGLSDQDVAQINKMYSCSNPPVPIEGSNTWFTCSFRPNMYTCQSGSHCCCSSGFIYSTGSGKCL